jgi:hypothetical protein
LVCRHLFSACISNEQKFLSDGAEKDIGKYHAALANVFDNLSEEEVKQCNEVTIEWNTKPLPDNIQHR